ncbi:DUF551 domain-containing protein [Kineothrix sedimenti]|uniref:DUF551 domain-containing protein n=1 Tax=Kineothrix sedimenti TaxID=3123317 RepID=A0ABZ3EUT5_9FIRM
MQEVFEKIIEKLHKDARTLYSLDSFTPVGAWKREDAIEVVKEVAAEYNNGWISASERLPEGNGNYTVTEEVHSLRTDNRILQTRAVGEVEFVDGKWRRAKHLKIIAWQPLPQPYEPKED